MDDVSKRIVEALEQLAEAVGDGPRVYVSIHESDEAVAVAVEAGGTASERREYNVGEGQLEAYDAAIAQVGGVGLTAFGPTRVVETVKP